GLRVAPAHPHVGDVPHHARSGGTHPDRVRPVPGLPRRRPIDAPGWPPPRRGGPPGLARLAGTPPRSAVIPTIESTGPGPGRRHRRPGPLALRDYVRAVPAERRSSQAWTTRLAMPASASLPQVRGSYAFLLPTSPSTFSTPSKLRNMCSAVGRVNAYCVSVSTFIFTTP